LSSFYLIYAAKEKLEIVSPFGSETLRVEDGAAPRLRRRGGAIGFVQ